MNATPMPMRPYSMDLRAKVLAAHDRGDASQRQLAAHFDLALSTVHGWIRRRRETGSLAPRMAPGATPKLDSAGEATLRALIEAAPDGTLAEWTDALAERTGVRLHGSTVWRYARRLGLSAKKDAPRR